SSPANAVALLYNANGFLPPVNMTGARSSFKIGSTIPLKIKVTDCNGTSVSTLHPDVDLKKTDSTPENPVNEVVSSSAADTGDDMRYDAGAPQYIYNLSTKRSQFCPSSVCSNGDLTAGTYEVKVSDPTFAPIVKSIDLRLN
ncbi:MAG: PxKF domain-containing protein, partial [Gaiellaceae bacterium]